MKKHGFNILYLGLVIGFCFFSAVNSRAWGKDFVVVIDPGHGGRDPGAVGKISQEKKINLNVALKLGEMIEKNCSGVKVVYTRKTDVFVALDKRAQIANNAKADLFISIHTNSVAGKQSPQGASTWTLGLARSDANLEVAKRENSVILLESDYQQRYAGFNPKSSESYIIFEFMQDKYMEQSVHLASLVQKEFKNTCKRIDRGVHQAGFLVLKESAMPSILVELGFISNPEEERYLNTTQGVTNLSRGIYNAFVHYKKEHDLRAGVAATGLPDAGSGPATAGAAEKEPTELPVFKVQFLTSSVKLPVNDKRLKGLQEVDLYEEGGMYKYTYGSTTDYDQVVAIRKKVAADFKDCFIIAFKNGRKVDLQTAISEFRRNKK